VPELAGTSLGARLRSAAPLAFRPRVLLAILLPLALVAVTYVSLEHLGAEADALAEREYQREQSRIAALAAERLGGLLDLWTERLNDLRLPASRGEWPARLTRADHDDASTLVFVHDEAGAVVASPERLPADRRAWLAGGERAHYPTVTRPLSGHAGLFVTAVIDPHALYERLFASLAGDYDAYIWVMDAYRTIVSAPETSATGTRPFDHLRRQTRAALEPLLAHMDAGESGVGSYPWGVGRHASRRLLAYESVPNHPGLSVAYSADAAAVRARTHSLHEGRRRLLLWLVALIALALGAAGIIFLRRLERAEAKSARLGQYIVEEKIGEGGMGVVYRARHALLRRPTAVKLLRADMISPARLEGFEREVRATARLEHPNTITVYDYGRTPEGVFYYAMELLDGITLKELVQRFGRQPPGRVKRILEQVAAALHEAHEAGLVHRDIKPGNIMICRQGGEPDVAKVLDFGLVRELEDESAEATKRLVGTPMYMSPEAIRSPESVDARSDLYALGAVAYFLLTGDHMYRAGSVAEVCAMHLDRLPRALSKVLSEPVPADLEAIIMRCLAKDPDDRPASAREVREALGRCAACTSWSREQACRFWSELEVERGSFEYPHADSAEGTRDVPIPERVSA